MKKRPLEPTDARRGLQPKLKRLEIFVSCRERHVFVKIYSLAKASLMVLVKDLQDVLDLPFRPIVPLYYSLANEEACAMNHPPKACFQMIQRMYLAGNIYLAQGNYNENSMTLLPLSTQSLCRGGKCHRRILYDAVPKTA